MEHKIELSVIIPSYNGAGKIINVLNQLSIQTFHNFEVIIIIDGSTDNSVEVIGNFKSIYPITIITQCNQGRSSSRNNGVDKAQAELLVFLDDDMLPEKDFLKKHYQFHEQHSNSALVGCAFRNPDAAQTAFDHYLIEVEKKWREGLKDHFKVTIEHFAFTGANFSISKSNFYKIGKFKGVLPDTEDFDFGVRTYLAKINIYYNIHVVAWHNDFPTMENFIKRLVEYKKSNQKLVELNPSYKELFPNHFNKKKVPQVKLFILSMVLKLQPQRWLLNTPVMGILPLRVKFLLYKLISSANLNCA